MDARELGPLLVDEIPGLLRFARTVTRDEHQSEDLVQETVARALERAETFRGDSSLATWLHRILHHLAVDRARRVREVPVDDLAAQIEARWRDDAYTVDASAVVLAAETRAELEDALLRLPVIYRTAVVLHDGEGWTSQAIADLLEIGLPAAKQRLRRGRMMLVSALARGSERREALRGVPLRCWDARSRVSDYLDGELDTSTAALVERHLEGCPTCPPLYASLVGATAALQDLQDPDTVVPGPLAQRIAAQLAGSR